jgi:hypothetical protein
MSRRRLSTSDTILFIIMCEICARAGDGETPMSTQLPAVIVLNQTTVVKPGRNCGVCGKF